MRVIIGHESAGKPETVVADKVDGGSELGGNQLYVEHDAAANPRRRSTAGAIGANVDPLTPLGSLYGAQWVYQHAQSEFAVDLAERKLIVPPYFDVAAWIVIMGFQHSLGGGGFRRLMDLGAGLGLRHPIAILERFKTTTMPPKLGRQSPKLVRRRIHDLLDLPGLGACEKPLPPRILPLAPRPPETPPFDAARAKRFILAERARAAVNGPRDPLTGSPM
jgi:hypothetical protein